MPSSIVWGYIRVSGEEQADRGLPVAGQRRAIETYAQEHALPLARWFVDEARSGGNDRREQFQLMMSLAHQDPAPCAAILLWSWSRFARDQNDAHFWKASLRRHQVAIIPVNGETPQVEGFEYVLESLIHWKDEQKLIQVAQDARRGQQALAARGYVPSGCRPPRGYRVQFSETVIEGRKRRLRQWVPDPDTWDLARRAWEMRLAGHSYRQIIDATRLYASPGCLASFFSNTTYQGELHFGDTLISVEPLVTPEEWEQVNAARPQRRTGAYPRRQGSRFLLSGLLHCARCGASLSGDSARGPSRSATWDHYICSSRKNRHACDLPRIGAEALQRAVLGSLLCEILTEDNLALQSAHIQDQLDAQRPALSQEMRRLEAEIATLDRAIERLLDAIERAPDSAALSRRLSDRESERHVVHLDLTSTRARLAGLGQQAIDVGQIRASLETALADTPQTARHVLSSIISDIVVDSEQVRLCYNFPFVIAGIR